MISSQFLRFLIAGGLAAFLNWSSRFLFSLWFDFEVAVLLAFFVGLASGFIVMRLFVFEQVEKTVTRQFGMYLVVNGLALVQTLVVSSVLARWILPAAGVGENLSESLAHLAGVLVPVVTSYFGHKAFTFG